MVYLAIVSDTLFPPEIFPKGIATEKKPPPLYPNTYSLLVKWPELFKKKGISRLLREEDWMLCLQLFYITLSALIVQCIEVLCG